MHLAARAPPPPDLVVRRLLWATSFCKRQFADQSFDASARWHLSLQIVWQSSAVLGTFWGLRRSANIVVGEPADLQIYIQESRQNLVPKPQDNQ